jgi:hypothetical protein
MSLNKSKLLNDLKNLPPVNNVGEAATNLAKVFVDYYSLATVADTKPVVPPLDALFLNTLSNNMWMQTLGTTLQSWFALYSWASPAFTGSPGTTVAVGSVLDTSLAPFIAKSLADKSDPPKDPLPEFVDIIDAWSKTITIALINISTGVPAPTVMA